MTQRGFAVRCKSRAEIQINGVLAATWMTDAASIQIQELEKRRIAWRTSQRSAIQPDSPIANDAIPNPVKGNQGMAQYVPAALRGSSTTTIF